MKSLVIGGAGRVSRLVEELCAREVDLRVLARQHPRPGTVRGKVEAAIGDLTDPPAIEAALIFFSIFRVNQFRNVPHFAAKVAVQSALRNCGVPFTVIGTAYWFQNERRSKARCTAKKSWPGTCRSSRSSAHPIRMRCGRSNDTVRTKS